MRTIAAASLALAACDVGGEAGRSGGGGVAARAVEGGVADTVLVALSSEPAERLGSAAAVVDVDDDGFDDVILGAPGDARDGAGRAGALWLWTGSPSGPLVAAGVRLAHPEGRAGDNLGAVLSSAGDVDGDGFDDVIAGMWGADPAGSGSGAAWLLYGSASGLSPERATTLAPEGLAPGDAAGRAVSGGHDLDGDGLDDLVLGAFGADGAAAASGAVWVVPGAEDGPLPDDGVALVAPDAAASDWLGLGLASVGDLDDDGYGDLLVGAPGRSGGGAVWLLPGGDAGPGFETAVDLTPPDGSEGAQLGAAMAGGRDLDGDGVVDAILAAPQDAGSGSAAGAVWVVFGGASPTVSDRIASPDPRPRATFGAALHLAPDLDGDGLADLVVGAPLTDGGRGDLWVLPGHATSGVSAATAFSLGEGPSAGDARGAAMSSGDLDADGAPDLVQGSWGDDRAGVQAGVGLVYLGCPGGDADADADGVCASADCDDADPAVGEALPVWADTDGDGYGDPLVESLRCAAGGGWVDNALDCDDTRASASPGGVEEVGDGVDGDCDGVETCYLDRDGDGFRTDDVVTSADSDCDDPFEAAPGAPAGDCDDTDAGIAPDAPDPCGDGIDSDCDGVGASSGDEDGDGLSWSQELALGTSDCDPDTDGDGLQDGVDDAPLTPAADPSAPPDPATGCSVSPRAGAAGAWALVALLSLRRRRPW